MLPQSQPRKKRNSSKVSLLISLAFHALLVIVMIYFAARSGLLGKQLQKISVTMEKEKPVVKPPEPPKVEPPKEAPKVESPKIVDAPKAQAPSVIAQPTVATPAAELPSFDFDGGKIVETSSDPVQIYRGYMEYVLHSKWHRPENMADDDYAAEIAVAVDKQGQISVPVWGKNSGDSKWDDSVKQVFNVVKSFDRPPPTNFPASVVIRFDVQSEATELILQ
jgi:TonB C terminal